ncbi:MAG: PASTA domain-containing protein [Armatimonadetes bacterium]|nr:PASTA domain-containing protein [Anaerolineae bacterium]
MRKAILVLLVAMLGWVIPSAAQEQTVSVPDLTGLNVPQAAALLNQTGLRLGVEGDQLWTAESGLPEDVVGSQSIAAAQSVAIGTAVDVVVLRANNALAIYDDNDFTLVNNSGRINLSGINLVALDGNPAQLNGARWAPTLRRGQCVQVWSVGRNGPKGLDECEVVQNWLVTNDTAEHFWTGAGGTSTFSIVQDGVQRAVCQVANPGRCEFYLKRASANPRPATDYVYFAYTPEQWTIINQSANEWMLLAELPVLSYVSSAEGTQLLPGDPALYLTGASDVANVSRLAPGQCLLYATDSTLLENPPQACDVIATLAVSADAVFWQRAFGMVSDSDGETYSCPAATAGRLTICVMPR